MSVIINGRFLSQRLTGVQRTAREIVRGVDQLICSGEVDGARWRFTVLAPPDARLDLPLQHLAVKRIGRLRGHAWEQLELPFHARGALLVSFANTGPLLARRQFVTVHDASVFAVPSTYSRLFRTWYQCLIPQLGKRAVGILTDSVFSRDELTHHAGIPTAKLRVIPLGREHILNVPANADVLVRHGIGGRPFVLAVGSRSPHKNFRTLLRAVEMLGENIPYDFVIAGGANARVFGSMPAGTTSRVKDIGYVTDDELRALYGHAACFIFPSIYEGFGLPPLEAMACGCPVIVSRAASLPEVCGDAAVYFNPYDSTELAQKIDQVMGSAVLRADLSRRGLEQASRFSWLESARAVMRVLDEVAGR